MIKEESANRPKICICICICIFVSELAVFRRCLQLQPKIILSIEKNNQKIEIKFFINQSTQHLGYFFKILLFH